MTTDDIVASIDRSLTAIAGERDQLLAARAELAGTVAKPPRRRPGVVRRRPAGRQGRTVKRVLEALHTSEPRTAGDVAKITGIDTKVAGATLIRLVKRGAASKAQRGYLRAASVRAVASASDQLKLKAPGRRSHIPSAQSGSHTGASPVSVTGAVRVFVVRE